jgi:hypothetical protein
MLARSNHRAYPWGASDSGCRSGVQQLTGLRRWYWPASTSSPSSCSPVIPYVPLRLPHRLWLRADARAQILLRAFSKRIRGAEDTTSRSGPGVSGRPVTVSVHVARSGPQGDFDDEDGWDSPGAHSLRAYPKTIASVDDSAGVDTKGSF